MGKNIVICDDAEFMKQVLRDILKEAGYNIVGIANNGKEACSLYKEQTPDLMIMDINMPQMDGLETLKAIRKMDKNALIVMCSSMNQPKMVMDTLRYGAKDFIIKPFQKQRVLEVVMNTIGEP